ANGSGYASFTFQVQDDGGTANGGVDLDPTPHTITVDVTPVNDAPTDVGLSGATLAENDTGAVIGTLSAIDPDVGDTHSFTVSDGRFEVVNGDQLQLKAGISLDFETEPSVSIDITATDQGGLDHTKSFVITVTDIEPENLTGDSGANLLVAGVGDDTLSGLAGNDTLIGGSGADVLNGGADDDALIWDSADTTVAGGTGTDTLLVGTGNIDLGAGSLSGIDKVDLGTAN